VKVLTTSISNHLTQDVTTIATCWEIARRDGITLRFTSLDQDLTIGGNVYSSLAGYTPSAVVSTNDFAVDNMTVDSVLDVDVITEEDLLGGIYDGASVRIFQVNWADPDGGEIDLKTGTIGEVRIAGDRFVVELRGLTSALQTSIGEVYSASCRASFGDSRCKVLLSTLEVAGAVTAVNTRLDIATTLTQEDGYFTYGRIEWLTGNNVGQMLEIKGFVSSVVSMVLPPLNDVVVGDTFKIVPGCDRTLDTCVSRWDNVLNFRGEPYVPGIEAVIAPGRRT
jgi:uncharacterized phage protein (TIGR02218 family)